MLHKILLVLRREYFTRVRKRSFIVMTILAPILVVLFYGSMIYFTVNRDIGDAQKNIYVADASGLFKGKLQNKKNIEFMYGELSDKKSSQELINSGFYAVLTIPQLPADSMRGISIIAKDQPSITTVKYIEDDMERILKEYKLNAYGIRQDVLKRIEATRIHINTDSGPESSRAMASTAIGYFGAILIYFFIFLYGVQAMRGVIEEKTNRIVEVIISSVKPIELMMGKIIGIALVGLTQFVIWAALVAILGGAVSSALMVSADDVQSVTAAPASDNELGNLLNALSQFHFVPILAAFVFYFVSGYLFYGSLFAAIGSAVDSETDTQQFMLPITMPLIFGFVLAQSVVTSNPNGSLAFWLSIIPFTSPVVMMVRIPFGVPGWEILVSMFSMVLCFLTTAWIAARIYRVGILMYGKKPSYKELGKWLFYKN